jgi:hypothetical protein
LPVSVKDLGIGKLKRELRQLKHTKILLGVQGTKARQKHPDADASVGLIALWNHYGTKWPKGHPKAGQVRIPARPWVDVAIDKVKDKAGVAVKRAVSDLIDGRASDLVEALTAVGEMGLKATVEAFDKANEWAKPLAIETVRAKGHAQPLLDTGTVREANSYTIRVGGKIKAEGGVDDLD